MEEDSPYPEETILRLACENNNSIPNSNQNSNSKNISNTPMSIAEKTLRLRRFHADVESLWRILDFNAYVSDQKCSETLMRFPASHAAFSAARKCLQDK